MALAVGGGMLREPGGSTVALGRVVAGREFGGWRLHGNLLLQKAMTTGRDPLDLVTTVGWARRLGRSVSLGVEGIAEDVEGFWNPEETEGGARLLVGPSLHIAPAGRRWQISAAGGPDVPSIRHRPPEWRAPRPAPDRGRPQLCDQDVVQLHVLTEPVCRSLLS